ncbi:type II secretion system protein [Candidatus Daviesbacteria bacterium]|nr:type II secretion system protein [Candidatus Daviesbacteria bacterium]
MKKSAQVHKGFTLVELLIVMAIMGILALVVLVIINPLEVTRRGRDSARLADLASLQQAINVAVQEATTSSAEILCSGTTAPCSGSSHTGSRSANGTGWIKVDLSSNSTMSVAALPIDQTNSSQYHYTYCSDGNAWEINATLESQQQSGKPGNDGGNDPALYEVGSNLGLIATSGGSCSY